MMNETIMVVVKEKGTLKMKIAPEDNSGLVTGTNVQSPRNLRIDEGVRYTVPTENFTTRHSTNGKIFYHLIKKANGIKRLTD